MTIAEFKDWLAIGVPLVSLVFTPALLWWMQGKFVLRTEFNKLTARLDHHQVRLEQGEKRFIELDAGIREIKHAADDAMRAADRATKAADKITGVLEKIAGMSETLRAVERQVNVLVDGHMIKGDGK